MSTLEIRDLSYTYDGITPVLSHLTYTFESGKIYAIVGKSGAGKTTLLSLLAGLTYQIGGRILLDGKSVASLNKSRYRSREIGIVFQEYHLLPKLTAVENIEVALDIAGDTREDPRAYILELLDWMGIEEKDADRPVRRLSGGQQQRVAIARALARDPKIILADEPTGNLDPQTQDTILDIFDELAHEQGKCIILVTHSPVVAKAADEVFRLYPAGDGEEERARQEKETLDEFLHGANHQRRRHRLEILKEREQEKARRARRTAERKARMEAYHEIEFDSSMAQLHNQKNEEEKEFEEALLAFMNGDRKKPEESEEEEQQR
ncbi:MAG: ABC transporter ATP-binding protein [Candidatus Heritagella sp.]